MKYIKLFEDVDEEVQSQEVQSQVEESDEDKGGEYKDLVDALREGVSKCKECSDKCTETGHGDCNRCLEASKVCELTLWAVETQSKYWERIVELCHPLCFSNVEYCMENGQQICVDALQAVVFECEKAIDIE